MGKTINIPTELCQWALQNRRVPLLKIYLYLQFNYSGKVRLGKGEFKDICQALGYKSAKQPTKHFMALLELDWIGFNPKSGYHFIRGIDTIRSLEGFKRQTAIEMEYKDIFHLREFCFSVVVENLNNKQNLYKKRKLRRHKQTVIAIKRSKFIKKITNQSVNSSVLFKPIANAVISKILGISKSSVISLKTKAKKLGYIQVKTNLKPFQGNTQGLNSMLAREYIPNLRYVKGFFYLQQPDLIKTSLKLKTRKKSDPYINAHTQGRNL